MASITKFPRESRTASEIVASCSEMLKSFFVDRPCGDLRLWQALISVLRMGSVVIFWPGGPPVVFNESVGSNLPRDMTEAIGPAKSARSAEDLLQLLRES
jgi:hypothetical protein